MSNPAEFNPFEGPAILATAPTTESQRELWTATQLGVEASLAFNESVSLFFDGLVDPEILRLSLSEVIGRHESLRCTFSSDGASLLLVALGALPHTHHDWRNVAASEQQSRWGRLLRTEVETPFDLEHGPLFRSHLVELSDRDVRLVFTAHHIACDGWSTGILVNELAATYSARAAGEASDLPKADSFLEYARTESANASGPQRQLDETFWTDRLRG